MDYHDNDVNFKSNGSGYSIASIHYVINHFAVTDGQDPDGKIFVGKVLNGGSDGKLSFRIGRKSSKSVANWFNNQISSSQSTFGHSADELNFAFIGTLTITLTGGPLGGVSVALIMKDIALAQGHSGSSNNWWFGGQHCSRADGDSVSTAAMISGTNLTAPYIGFARGGNAVDVVDVTGVSLINATNWMSQIDATTTLNNIVLPGSHDAGMSTLSHCFPGIGPTFDVTKTQALNVGEQLSIGSRYFDIRVDYDHGELVTYHRTGKMGCNGQTLMSVLDQIRTFLIRNNTETAIFKFSHIRSDDGHDSDDIKSKINDLLNSYSNIMYTNAASTVVLAGITLKECAGKAIMVFDYDNHIDPLKGRFRYADVKPWDSNYTPPSNTNLLVLDSYADTNDFSKMKGFELDLWQKYGGMGQNTLFLLSWTLTAEPVINSTQNLAREANGKLSEVLSSQIRNNGWSKPNIVYLDFIGFTECETVVAYNNFPSR